MFKLTDLFYILQNIFTFSFNVMTLKFDVAFCCAEGCSGARQLARVVFWLPLTARMSPSFSLNFCFSSCKMGTITGPDISYCEDYMRCSM